MTMMSPMMIQRCLVLLREADGMLMTQREYALAAHLSLVIELLAARQEQPDCGAAAAC
ncbi:hypothetical protein [Sphingomonas nostoxanthinifaciens]|uniref:hypothetical protein n=1 Tax=Sphingomonas nostoxanthinifaciens TaxID=2872652 RepID=UPI001CC20C5C|nr:hypothetical protein [Sphingomonas nostoxanthinifaciens]UAK23534.1 hypothetical protein K8P63_14215 [Sphingomonas nostoxanthinifaciens]